MTFCSRAQRVVIFGWIGTALLSVSVAASPWRDPVSRRTRDRDADSIAALLREGRFDDAESLCRLESRGLDPLSDSAAKWAIRASRVAAARESNGEDFSAEGIKRAEAPIEEILAAYAEHPRRLFLEAQRVAVHREAARFTAISAAVSSDRGELTAKATRRLVDAVAMSRDLIDRVDAERSILARRVEADRAALAEDLERLQQELQVDVVSMAMLQVELFPRGSHDAIAAATRAEAAADEAMARLDATSPARIEVQRIKVDAILRAGQAARANEALAALVGLQGAPLPAATQALQVRVDLAAGRSDQAERRLQSYFGDEPESAPRSVEMDLARLWFLLEQPDTSPVGRWLDAMERRGGAYARRRAEAVSLAHLRTASVDRAVDPSLVASQGRDWLRRGNAVRAGELLAAAAAVETNADRAVRYAVEAAAAFVSAERHGEASEVLATISQDKPDGSGAAEAHLQSATLVATVNPAGNGAMLEGLLRSHLSLWPRSETASVARRWLVQWLRGMGRELDAAEVATELPVGRIGPADLELVGDSWQVALRRADPSEFAEASRRFRDAFEPLTRDDTARRQYDHLATLLLDREDLSDLTADSPGGDPFSAALRRFRSSARVTDDALRSPPAELRETVRWRLMRDGRLDPNVRPAVAELIESWPGLAEDPLGTAERLLWLGRTDEAIARLQAWKGQSAQPVEAISQAARLLSQANDPRAKRAAVALWDDLAAGTPQGSEAWHNARLGAIGVLAEMGDGEEARRRAKYILLTTPHLPPDLKSRYERRANRDLTIDR